MRESKKSSQSGVALLSLLGTVYGSGLWSSHSSLSNSCSFHANTFYHDNDNDDSVLSDPCLVLSYLHLIKTLFAFKQPNRNKTRWLIDTHTHIHTKLTADELDWSVGPIRVFGGVDSFFYFSFLSLSSFFIVFDLIFMIWYDMMMMIFQFLAIPQRILSYPVSLLRLRNR